MDRFERTEGARARKKRETQRRISDKALELFLTKGYDSTTLDEIAAGAGIARRTFFSYFKTKEAILMAYVDGGFAPSFRPILLAQARGLTPLEAVQRSLLELFSARDEAESMAVHRLLESTEGLRTRMLAVPFKMERAVFEVLCEIWPAPEDRDRLRMVAVVSIGALRVAKEAWRNDEGRSPLSDHLRNCFAMFGNV
jgi:AcrR family transcriptional regulator